MKINKHLKTYLILICIMIFGFLPGVFKDRIFNAVNGAIFRNNPATGYTISADTLKKMLDKKNFLLINVHTPYEGEIPQTDYLIPYDRIPVNSAYLPKDKNARIILYCRSGRMSAEALDTFHKLGYTNVTHLTGGMDSWQKNGGRILDLASLQNQVVPQNGFTLDFSVGKLLPQLVNLGVIDLNKFTGAVKPTDTQLELLTKGTDQNLTIDSQNSQFIVDILWALGLAQKSEVYMAGPMGNDYKDSTANFASTGGWSLSRTDGINYLNRFELIGLTPDQQDRIGRIAQNVFRPCCGNSTWFPDCNHGMAALAAIELMVSRNLDNTAVYRNLLELNSFWFPDSYLKIAAYFTRRGTLWQNVNPQEILGKKYSSGQGASGIAKKVGVLPFEKPSGGSCGA